MSCKIRNHELTNPDVFQALAASMAGLPESKRGKAIYRLHKDIFYNPQTYFLSLKKQ